VREAIFKVLQEILEQHLKEQYVKDAGRFIVSDNTTLTLGKESIVDILNRQLSAIEDEST
jgi:hypothetical protein